MDERDSQRDKSNTSPDAALDPSYGILFSQFAHPGSTSFPYFDNLMQQSAMQPPTTFSWNPTPQFFQQSQAGPSQYHSMTAFQFPDTMPGTTSQQSTPQGPTNLTGHAPILPEVDLEVAEEKRSRNTAASARFRIKKKHKAIALERSVTDLTGRADELEREVADLRRENGWLKEIVILKGAQFAANRWMNQEALRQAAASGQIKLSSEEGSEDGREQDADDGDKSQRGERKKTLVAEQSIVTYDA